jgi:hypothetical protein
LILPKAHAVGQVVVVGAVVVVAGLIVSADDYFAKERNAADQETMKEINQRRMAELAPVKFDL